MGRFNYPGILRGRSSVWSFSSGIDPYSSGLYFTFKTKFLPFRLFPEMIRVTLEKDEAKKDENSISGVQALIVATATRVGMGNLAGVVAAISFGGAGCVFSGCG